MQENAVVADHKLNNTMIQDSHEEGTKTDMISASDPIAERPDWGAPMSFAALQQAGVPSESSASSEASEDRQGDDEDARSEGGMSTVSEIREEAAKMSEAQREELTARIKRFAARHQLRARAVNSDWAEDDLELEMQRLQGEVALQRSLKFQRRALLTFTSGVEYVHTKTPLNGKLDGWGEIVLEQIDDYDDVFERLHAKHAPKLGVSGIGKQEEPEIQLLRMLAYSAFTHSITTSIAKMALQPNVVEERKQQAAVRIQQSAKDTDKFIGATKVSIPSGGGNRTVELG